jgi:hypothetical protein
MALLLDRVHWASYRPTLRPDYGSCGIDDFGKEIRNIVVYRVSSESLCTVRPQATHPTGSSTDQRLFRSDTNHRNQFQYQDPLTVGCSDGVVVIKQRSQYRAEGTNENMQDITVYL